MKWLRTLVLFDKGGLISSSDWQSLHQSYVRAIESIDHPGGSGSLVLRRKVKLPNGKWARNGVGYLRKGFLDHICDVEGWVPEGTVDLDRGRKAPPVTLYPSLDVCGRFFDHPRHAN